MGVMRESWSGRRSALALALACASAILLAGCGSSGQKQQARQLEGASILSSTAPLSERLLKQSEVDAASDTDGEQTFLRLWSLLQVQSWDRASEFFMPGLRDLIGENLLTEALASDAIVWLADKPHILYARAAGGGAVVAFLARSETGTVIPASVSFERSAGSWHISYFSLLDPALQRAAQSRAQAQIEPLATKPAVEAVRQGANALHLQGAYREQVLRESRKAGGSTP